MAGATAAKKRHPLQPRSWSLVVGQVRFDAVTPLMKDKKVLDVGGGTGRAHRRIAEVAREIVGFDRDARLVERAQSEGFDMRLGDAQAFDLGEQFDVVWAGELIEHLSNAGLFLDAAAKHLGPDGRLVMTTPNAFAISNVVYRLWGSVRVNEEHTCWYCEQTLQALLERHGYLVERMEYLPHQTPGRVRRLLAGAVRAPLPDRLASNTLLVVARRAA